MRRLLLVCALLGWPATTASGAQTAPSDSALAATTRAVASELRCPVCQGLSIQDSPTELAREMRAVVEDQLAAGSTPEEVKDYFVAKYGEWILLRPRAEGFNLAVYLLPLGALLAGAGVVLVAVRRWTGQGTDPATEPPAEG